MLDGFAIDLDVSIRYLGNSHATMIDWLKLVITTSWIMLFLREIPYIPTSSVISPKLFPFKNLSEPMTTISVEGFESKWEIPRIDDYPRWTESVVFVGLAFWPKYGGNTKRHISGIRTLRDISKKSYEVLETLKVIFKISHNGLNWDIPPSPPQKEYHQQFQVVRMRTWLCEGQWRSYLESQENWFRLAVPGRIAKFVYTSNGLWKFMVLITI